MLKLLLLNAEPGGETTTGSGGAVNPQPSNPTPAPAPATPINGAPNELAAAANGIVHQLSRYDTQSQLKILNAVCIISGIKLPN